MSFQTRHHYIQFYLSASALPMKAAKCMAVKLPQCELCMLAPHWWSESRHSAGAPMYTAQHSSLSSSSWLGGGCTPPGSNSLSSTSSMRCGRPLHVRIESIRSRLMVSFRMMIDSSISGAPGPAESGPVAGASGRLSMNRNSSTLDRRWWRSSTAPLPRPGRYRKLYHRSLRDDCDGADRDVADDVLPPPPTPCLLCTFRLMVLSSGKAAVAAATSRWCLVVITRGI